MMNQNMNSLLEAFKQALKNVAPVIIEQGKELVNQVKDEAIPAIKEEVKATVVGISEDAAAAWKEFKEELKKPAAPQNVVTEEVEVLNAKGLTEIAKAHIVDGSNEVYAMKQQKDDAIFVYLSYGKDKELLEQEQNCYVIIKTEALTADVMNLLEENKVIILK